MFRLRRPSRRGLIVAALCGVVLVVLGTWLVDAASQRHRVAHRVILEGVDVSGLSREELLQRVTAIANRFEAVPVTIHAGSRTLSVTEGELGATIDRAATVDTVMKARHGSFIGSFTRWAGSLFSDRRVGVSVTFDSTKLGTTVTAFDQSPDGAPVEPTLEVRGGEVTVVGGRAGLGVDASAVGEAVRSHGFATAPLVVDIPELPRQPHTSLATARQVADEANALTATPLDVTAGTATTTLTSTQLRHWIIPAPNGPFNYTFDSILALLDLRHLLSAGDIVPVDAVITLDAKNTPVIVPSVDGGACCTPEAVGTVVAALRTRPSGRVVLPLDRVAPKLSTAQAEALGIKEPVAAFTTKHPCCAARVQNIHRLADMVRGVLIKPGETFSFNKFIGERTVARGWVIAPTIIDGALQPSPGGGISQFMTTMFNAAWFAGLEFAEYSSHSIYITRYPFGREATISWPSPDLQVTDSTPYGIVIWPTYTETSITVTIYSTKLFAKVEQGPQTATFSGKSCSSITTPRIRTYLDGTVKKDVFFARYQAKEGLLCTDPLPPGVSPIAVPGQPPPSVPPSATVPSTTTTVPLTTTPAPPTTAPPPTTSTTRAP